VPNITFTSLRALYSRSSDLHQLCPLYSAPNVPTFSFKLLPLTAFTLSLLGCEGFEPLPVEFSQEDIVRVGDVRTIEIQGTIISSLPETFVEVSPVQAELGRLLFWDPILSGNLDVACATCHLPENGYTDALAQSIGVGGTGVGADRTAGQIGHVPRNAQTILNSLWNGIDEFGLFDVTQAPMFWDNRVQSLATQALEPIVSAKEMRGEIFSEDDIKAEIESRLNANTEYLFRFEDAFSTNTITMEFVAKALTSFQSTLIANQSPFDRWMRGEPDSMTNEQLSGLQEFVVAGCAECHSGPLFSDFETHVLGVQEGIHSTEPDNGDGMFGFRTPTLRQLQFTAPYFHAGQFETITAAIDFYDERRRSANANVPSEALDEKLLVIGELDGQAQLIENFLKALNDDSFDSVVPEAVPSGLTPGGF